MANNIISISKRNYNDEISELEKKLESVSLDIFELQKNIDSAKAMNLPDTNRKYALRSFERQMDILIEESNKLEKEIESVKEEKEAKLEEEENNRIEYNIKRNENAEKYERERIERIAEKDNAISEFLMNHTNIYKEFSEKFDGDANKIYTEVYKEYRDDINQIILNERNKKREEAVREEIKKMHESRAKASSNIENEDSYEMSSEDLHQASEIKSIQEKEGLSYEDAVKKYWENRKEAEPVVEEVPSPLTFEESLENKTDNILDNINETNNESKEAKPAVAAPALPEEKQPETPNKEPEEVPVTPIENKLPVEQIQSDPSVSFESNDSEIDEEPKTNDIPDDAEEEKLLNGSKQKEDSKWSIRRAVKNIAQKVTSLYDKAVSKLLGPAPGLEKASEPDNKTFRANTIMSTNDTNFKEIADEVVNVDNTTYKKEMNR